jgi:nitroimidazol reductase NimA-like FMN-containing flavoprotein (pyridoxamine 5'-phosphate oxidase superfamily)
MTAMSFHVRRKDREITDVNLLKKVLKSAKYVTIALCRDNEPYLVSLSHGYDEEHNCLYFHCATEGKKIVFIKANNNVWGQAMIDYGYVDGECSHLYASVHFSGKVTLIDSPDEKRRAIECMIRHLDPNPEVLLKKLNPEKLKTTAIGRIDIEYVTGKKPQQIKI